MERTFVCYCVCVHVRESLNPPRQNDFPALAHLLRLSKQRKRRLVTPPPHLLGLFLYLLFHKCVSVQERVYIGACARMCEICEMCLCVGSAVLRKALKKKQESSRESLAAECNCRSMEHFLQSWPCHIEFSVEKCTRRHARTLQASDDESGVQHSKPLRQKRVDKHTHITHSYRKVLHEYESLVL